MSRTLIVSNRQRTQRLDTKFLRSIIWKFVTEELGRDDFELGVSIVGEEMMTRMNEAYLRHKGSTDVITFDYRDAGRPDGLAGELFVCLDEASVQAPRFRATWQNELVRYIVHGILHLCGFDDKTADARKKMKREEDRLMRGLASGLKLERIMATPQRDRIAARRD